MGDMELQVFSDRIKKLRLSLDMTQKKFAEEIGITASALSSYEKNLKNPSIAVAKKIAEAFHVSIDWLCGLSDKMKNGNEPETYADIIDLLVKTEKSIYFRVGKEKIIVSDSVLQYFLEDWGKMLPLFHNGTIDDKLYRRISNYYGSCWKSNNVNKNTRPTPVLAPTSQNWEFPHIWGRMSWLLALTFQRDRGKDYLPCLV